MTNKQQQQPQVKAPEPVQQPVAPEPAKDGDRTYKVAKDRSVTSLRGIRESGEVVSARDFVGGNTDIEWLIECGAIEK